MEENITITAGTGTATPVGETMEQTLNNTAEAIQQAMDSFPDEEVSPEEQKKAQGFLHNFMGYISGNAFHEDVMKASRKYKIPPKKIAQGFFQSCLGTIGDILGIAIGTVGNAGHTLINIISSIAHGAVNLVVKVANGLASIVTLNKTCVCAA